MTKQKVIRIPIQNYLKYHKSVPMSAATPSISSDISGNRGITLELKENNIIITIDRNILHTDNNCRIQVNNVSTNTARMVVPSTRRKSTSEENSNDTLLKTFACLSEGLWYHFDVNLDEAKSLLKDAKEGTFLLRNSNHPSFIFTLSIATAKSGVTSIRIGYKDGLFFLDCDERVRPKMPHFLNVIELIYFYSGRPLCGRGECSSPDDHQRTKKMVEPRRPKCVWIDAKKRKYLPVQLTSPKLLSLPSLKHACRLRINSSIENKCEELENSGQSVSVEQIKNQLQIPKYLQGYLQSYPYSI